MSVSDIRESGPAKVADLTRSKPTVIKDTPGYKVFRIVNLVVMVVVCAVIILPLLNIVALAFSSEAAVTSGQVGFWPVGFSTSTFMVVVSDSMFWRQYLNTVIYTVLYTLIAMFLTTTFAYAISRKDLVGKSFFTWVALFTMFFSGGMIPSYVLIRELHMMDTIWAMVLPGTISVFNLLVMKTSFENFPKELEEAAYVDGMTTYGVFFRIVLPLSKAIIATMVLFYAVSMWNSWWGAFLYLTQKDLFPVTMYLRNLIAGINSQGGAAGGDVAAQAQINANIKSVAMVLTVLPIICVYPFVQKYFVSGVMLGAVKA
ncbi:MAG: carbohydrate ABC transporter permease [Propionibacteriaceae bacterium]|nr:carbohydrate ABC transporter permease [Propionibacteriaceae bacterium]